MAKSRKISPEVQQIIVRLSAILSKDDIAINTGISTSTIKRILQYFEKNNSIPADAEKEQQRLGRPRLLRDEDVEVFISISYHFQPRSDNFPTTSFCLKQFERCPIYIWMNYGITLQ
jgi:transposase